MSKRTYAPGLARRLQDVQRYWIKHQAKIQAVASAEQLSDMMAISTAISSTWQQVPTEEQP